jgi:hypothetical protein
MRHIGKQFQIIFRMSLLICGIARRGVVAPLFHAVAHGQHLPLKPGTGVANRQVHSQRKTIYYANIPVLARHQ